MNSLEETGILSDKRIYMQNINSLAHKLYIDITQRGIEGVKDLYSQGETLTQGVRFDESEEYIKKMIMAQLNVGYMLFLYKYQDGDWTARFEYNKEIDDIRKQIETKGILSFDTKNLDSLFGRLSIITSENDYKEWKKFVEEDSYKGKSFETIYFEEEFRFNYEHEKNPISKFFESLYYRQLKKRSVSEDSYIKKVRDMISNGIIRNPNNPYSAYTSTRSIIRKEIVEYENIKEVEGIVRMTLASLTVQQGKTIDIETVCNAFRKEMENTMSLTKSETGYRQRQVTLGSESSINKRPVIHTISFQDVPATIKVLQGEYEKAYNTAQTEEDYIRQITKIYVDYIYIQPYEDGNKRTAICLFNTMLLSKGIIPPPISLINDEEMVEAFDKVQDKDYTMLQDLVIEKYRRMQKDHEFGSDNILIQEDMEK